MLQLGLSLGLGPGNGNGSYGVHGLRTITVRDVTMMYCKEPYMENVPLLSYDVMQSGARLESLSAMI